MSLLSHIEYCSAGAPPHNIVFPRPPVNQNPALLTVIIN